MLRILSATVLTAFAQESDCQVSDCQASDVDLLGSDEALSLMQLRAARKDEDSSAQPEWTMPDGRAIVDWMFSYEVPAGWRIGYGTGNRSAAPWILPNGQFNARISHQFVDYKQRSLEECVAEVQRNDVTCLGANGVSWGMVRWAVSHRGERYMAGYSKKCICDFCWNPIPQDWISRPWNPDNWVSSLSRPPSGESSDGAAGGGGWITAGPGTLDPSKYSEKRKASIYQRQEQCGHMEGWDPLLGMQTTTTTTTQAALEPEAAEDEAGAVGDPHITTNTGKKFDLTMP